MTSVGYGDITPTNYTETVLCIIIQLIGVMVTVRVQSAPSRHEGAWLKTRLTSIIPPLVHPLLEYGGFRQFPEQGEARPCATHEIRAPTDALLEAHERTC